MKRESFIILTIKGIGAVVFGNVLCAVMTMAVFMFGNHLITKILAIAFSAAIFFSLIFTAAWKNGTRERSLVKLGRVSDEKKYRWIFIGIIMFAFAAAPTVYLLINKLFFPEQDNLIIYQFISGSAYPFVIAFTPSVETLVTEINRVQGMSVMFPILMTAYYALIPVITQIGFRCGYTDKISVDRIVYK